MMEGWLRRRFLWYFRKDVITRAQGKKDGECARCGACCIGCVFYKRQNSHCRIYARRPATCKVFPLTHEDIKNVPTCGYYFKND
jgi:hypothetical protein